MIPKTWQQNFRGLFTGVGARLAASFFAVALLVLIPSLIWFYYYAQDLTERRIQDLLRSVLVHDYSLLNHSIETRDHWQLYRLVRSMARPAHVISVAVVDAKGNLLAHSDPAYYGRKNYILITNKNYDRVPLQGMRGPLGEIIVHRDNAVLKSYFAPVKRAILLISGVFALLAALLGVLIAFFWRNRLIKILNHMQSYPGSLLANPSSSLQPEGGDELDQLERQLVTSFEQLHISQWILDSVSQSVFLVDLSGGVYHANAAAKNLCACGECYKRLLSLLDRETSKTLLAVDKGTVNTRLTVCDNTFPALLSFRHYVGSEQNTRMVVTLTDLTEYQRLEGRLEKLRVLSLMGEMSTELAHEIRNDLAPVKLLCGMSGLAAEDKEVMLASLNRVDDMIDGFMSFVRGGQQAPTYLNLKESLEASCRVLEALAEQQGVKLHLQADEQQVCVPQGSFNLTVINLVRNAIQAVGKGGDVWVSAKLQGSLLTLMVADNGPGIAAELADQIFEPFVSQRQGGTGMGLALVLRHVDEVGGNVSHQPREGGGTVFTLRWPLTKVN